jgi:hypothetical protein
MQRDQAIKQIYTECGALIFLSILELLRRTAPVGLFSHGLTWVSGRGVPTRETHDAAAFPRLNPHATLSIHPHRPDRSRLEAPQREGGGTTGAWYFGLGGRRETSGSRGHWNQGHRRSNRATGWSNGQFGLDAST